jgi:hypothetical protein
MWRPFVVNPDPGSTPLQARVGTDPNWEWQLDADGESLGAGPDRWFLAAQLRYWLVATAVERSPALLLHAAVVSREGRALVAMADSGGGKTTLSLALADRGWSYHGDDLAAIDPHSLQVTPLPTPAGIRDVTRWKELSGRWGGAAPWPPAESFLVPATGYVAAGREPLTAGALAFIEHAPEAASAAEPVAPAEAIVLCTGHGAKRTPESVAALAALCRSTPAVRLRYGSTDAALALVEELWTGAVTQRSEPTA